MHMVPPSQPHLLKVCLKRLRRKPTLHNLLRASSALKAC